MHSRNNSAFVGLALLLIALGVLFLLQNFGLMTFTNLIWLVVFGVGGLVFLFVFAQDQEQWWALIPGFTLLGLGTLIGLGDRLGTLGPAIFLGSIGLSFAVIYIIRRGDFWWAIIPAGTLLSLALMIALEPYLQRIAAEETVMPAILFLGLAATFGLVYLVSLSGKHMTWALIPAGILAVIGVLMFLSIGGLVNYLWAVVLIVVGCYMLLRAFRPRIR
jgi:hypothetical protein